MFRNARHLAATAAIAAAAISYTAPASAGQDAFIGEMMLVGQNWCPRGWAPANGQLMSISQNTALFSLVGTIYGGDGRTTFALPDLRGRTPISQGAGSGLSNVVMGEKGGTENVTLTVNQMPAHDHSATATSTLNATPQAGDQGNPAGNVLARDTGSSPYRSGTAAAAMDASSVSTSVTVGNNGGNQPVNVRNPYLGMQWCIALTGIYPSRN